MDRQPDVFQTFLRVSLREHIYDESGLTPQERLRERQSMETKELLMELRSLLESELLKDSAFF